MSANSVKRDYVTIVSGLPRSGTSLAMSMIGAGGIELVTDETRTADEDNPKGYYEFEPVKQTKRDASWLDKAAGKAVKMVYRLLYDLPESCQYRIIFMERNLGEVVASQNKMLVRNGSSEGGLSDFKTRMLFVAELNKCRKWLSGQSNFDVLYVNYRDMIDDGSAQAEKISQFLGGGLDVKAMAAVVDPNLYRNRS